MGVSKNRTLAVSSLLWHVNQFTKFFHHKISEDMCYVW